jgi:membrane protease YdiL (CAAX protease family)
MIAAIPLSESLGELTKMLPFSQRTFEFFQKAEDAYMKQVLVIGRMNNFIDYLVSLVMLAVLPGMFEETFFRGCLQNLLSRWWKMPVVSIIVTAIIFSIVHGSYFGFLSRVVLGFVLGWMYYRTGNIWLNIIAHAFYNATSLTLLYLKSDVNMPLWWSLVSLPAIFALFILFDKISQYQVNKPGEEVIIRMDDYNQPSWVTDRP